jgi:hypothetical protein
MSFLNISIVVLASMVIVLAGMVGYLYFQQARLLHSVNSLGALVASMYVPSDEESEEEEDDRASVEKEPEVEVVNAPDNKKPIVEEEESAPASPDHVDTDELQDKTAAELKDMLTKKGIPFGKRDAKTVLIQLLKATA